MSEMSDFEPVTAPPAPTRIDWAAFTTMLRVHPGQWFRVTRRIKHFTFYRLKREYPDIEWEQRNRRVEEGSDATYEVYARYPERN